MFYSRVFEVFWKTVQVLQEMCPIFLNTCSVSGKIQYETSEPVLQVKIILNILHCLYNNDDIGLSLSLGDGQKWAFLHVL